MGDVVITVRCVRLSWTVLHGGSINRAGVELYEAPC